MSVDWGRFLSGLERHVRAHPWQSGDGGGQPDWDARPPAGDADVAALQGRFGVTFPTSYDAFLRTCNGLTMSSHPVGRFFGAVEVNWFRKEHNDWIRAYTGVEDPAADREPPDEAYYGYAADARPFFRPGHFRHTIQVSVVGDSAVYLLNPQVVWPSGEWEAWFLANWNPGVVRYRSFAELMWEQYGGHAGIDEAGFGLVREASLPTVYQDPPGKADRKVKKLRVRKPPRPLAVIGRDVRDGDLPTLQKAIKELARLKTPEALALLGGLLKSHPVHLVREDVAHALASERRVDAVPLLIEALADEYYGTAGAAADALGRIGDVRAVEPLLKLLEKRGHFTFYAAASALAKFREPRAAESLGRLLRSNDPRDATVADNAAVALSQFGDSGRRDLLDAMENGDARAKLRAMHAALHYPAADVEPVLRKLLAEDLDAGVRDAAAQALSILPQLGGTKRR